MANVLVTGGAGYVGSVCSGELLRQGHSVTVVDDLSTGFRDAVPGGATFVEANIGDRARMERALARGRFDAVFHFAAKALIPESVRNPGVFFEKNVAAGISMLETLRGAGIRNLVFSSSAAVYGTPATSPITEDCPTRPLNAYGLTKLMMEQTLEWYARAYGWSVTAFRYFSAAGAAEELGERHHPETHVIPLLLEAAAGQRETFDIYGDDYETPDGTCVRDFVHVVDIARAHICAFERMDQPGMRIYNIGSGVSYSVRQLCEAAARITGRMFPIRMTARREGDPAVLCADPRRMEQELNWRPEHSSIEEILRSAWQWKQRQLSTQAVAR